MMPYYALCRYLVPLLRVGFVGMTAVSYLHVVLSVRQRSYIFRVYFSVQRRVLLLLVPP